VSSLAEQLLAAVRDRAKMREIGLQARKVYEEKFTINRFTEEFLRLVKG
jgi:glycosyltransferase involved in cell wall biosynthesis